MPSTPAKKAAPSLSDYLGDKEEDKSKAADPTVDSAKSISANKDDVDKQSALEDSNPDNYLEEDESNNTPSLSKNVVSTVPNKTPAELAAETPEQTEARYGIDQTITDEDADNPRVQVYRDTPVKQVPGGTHLHPDIAKAMLNRGISELGTDNAQVKRTVTEYHDFAPDAEYNDKFQKPVEDAVEDNSDDVVPNAGSTV